MKAYHADLPTKPSKIVCLESILPDESNTHLPAYLDCRPIDARCAVSQAGFTIKHLKRHALWNLPVALVLAYKA